MCFVGFHVWQRDIKRVYANVTKKKELTIERNTEGKRDLGFMVTKTWIEEKQMKRKVL